MCSMDLTFPIALSAPLETSKNMLYSSHRHALTTQYAVINTLFSKMQNDILRKGPKIVDLKLLTHLSTLDRNSYEQGKKIWPVLLQVYLQKHHHTLSSPAKALSSWHAQKICIEIYASEIPIDTLSIQELGFRTINETSIELLQFLLFAGLDPNIYDDKGMTMLMRAAEAGQIKVIHLLIKTGADAYLSINENSAVLRAAFSGNLKTVMALKEAGVNINAPIKLSNSERSYTPLSLSLFHQVTHRTKAPETLIEAKAIVNILENDLTPLMIAASSGQTELVRQLLEAGAQVHIKNSKGFTARMRAEDSELFEAYKGDFRGTIQALMQAEKAQSNPEESVCTCSIS